MIYLLTKKVINKLKQVKNNFYKNENFIENHKIIFNLTIKNHFYYTYVLLGGI